MSVTRCALSFSLLTACTLASGCVAQSDDASSTSTEAVTVPAWLGYWDYQGVDLDTATNSARTSGYRPISISAWGNPSAPRYAAVFVQRTGPAFKVLRGVGNASWQNTFSSEAAASYKPSLVSFDGDAGNPVWAAVFVATTTGIPYTRNGLVAGNNWSDNTTLEYWLEYAHHNNLIPSTLSIYGTAASPAYTVVLEPNTANVQWSVGQTFDVNGYWNYKDNESHAEYQARWDAQVPAGNRVGIVELNGTEHYVSMYRDDSVGPLVGRHGWLRADLDAEIAKQKAAGYFPISIQGGGDGANARFAMLFAQSDLPLPKQTSSIGSGKATDTNIAAIDNAVLGFMARHGVRQAQLAVLSGKKLAYARGYSDQEPGIATTNATTTFRLASVSKVVTAMEIMHLVDRGQLSLDDKVQSILNLKTYTGASPPALFGTITVRNLLQHYYPSLWVNGATRCLARDIDVSQNAATKLGVALPLTRAQALSVELAASDLVARVPTNDGCYSNLGYVLLGQIVEAKRGAAFLSAVESDLFGPLSITHAHVASGLVSAQPANEAVYRTDQLFTVGNVNLAGSPLAATVYGWENFNVTETAGGLSMAATDVARLLSVLGIGANNPVYNHNVTSGGTTSTQDQILQGMFGFDQSPTDAWGNVHYVKGGEIEGTQTTVSYVKGGVGYVLLWAHDSLDNLASPDSWWPAWGTLETAIHNASLSGRPDEFPAYGMPSL